MIGLITGLNQVQKIIGGLMAGLLVASWIYGAFVTWRLDSARQELIIKDLAIDAYIEAQQTNLATINAQKIALSAWADGATKHQQAMDAAVAEYEASRQQHKETVAGFIQRLQDKPNEDTNTQACDDQLIDDHDYRVLRAAAQYANGAYEHPHATGLHH